MTSSSAEPKMPRTVLDDAESTIYAFPPNRETLGGTAYLLTHPAGNILVDTPSWTTENQTFLTEHPVKWLFISHRGGIGKHLTTIQQTLQCQVLIQEQEAYLIPELDPTTFQHTYNLTDNIIALWTSGHSPGSSCLYSTAHGGVLFSGRHLMPDRQGNPMPLRTAKTFHWPRQLRSVAMVRDRFNADTLQYICPGASTGFLRGKLAIANAHTKLMAITQSDFANQTALL